MEEKSNTPTSPATQNNQPTGTKKFHSRFRNNRKKNTKGSSRPPQKKKEHKNPVVPRRPPIFTYLSKCCGLAAKKPAAGKKVEVINPESKKTEKATKGLGHWRCTGCGKACRVDRQIAKKEELTVPTTEVNNVGIPNNA